MQAQQDNVKKLRQDEENGKIAVQRSGVIQSVTVATGGTIVPNTVVAIIETTDQGYSIFI